MICASCFAEYIRIRIRDNEVMPWLPCPDTTCNMPVHYSDLTNYDTITAADLFKLCQTNLRKHLARSENFIPCKNESCSYGFVLQIGEKRDQTCDACLQYQSVELKSEATSDSGLAALIANGTMRDCPRCHHYTIKEYGLCNVIECPSCSIFWNWRTKDTANSSTELKQKARLTTSLWEPGQLEYQQQLEQNNFSAFRALLGDQYDPNYVRRNMNKRFFNVFDLRCIFFLCIVTVTTPSFVN